MWHPRKSSGTRGTGGESGAAETVTPPVGRGSSPRAIIHYPGYVAENLKKQLSVLSKRGPHRVLVGDLDFAGLPGKVYTPAEGSGIPGVAFGHDWMLGLKRYHATLRHLASWGIAVAAPSTETGFTPNHRGFAADLQTALQVLAGVKLGSGNVTVSPKKLGLAGHGMGGGAAILAALDNPQAKAVATIFPAVTSPSNYEAAKHMTVPGLVIDSETNGLMDAGNPATVAFNWGADVAYRQISNGNQLASPRELSFTSSSASACHRLPPKRTSAVLSRASCCTSLVAKRSTPPSLPSRRRQKMLATSPARSLPTARTSRRLTPPPSSSAPSRRMHGKNPEPP